MSNFFIVDNPAIREVGLKLHKRDVKPNLYRKNTKKLGEYMGVYLATLDILPTKEREVITPVGKKSAVVVDDTQIGIVNVLRAGTPMALGMADLFSNSTVAFVSAWRREECGKMVADTDYSRGIEDLNSKFVILTDPALASGSSILATLDVISEYIDVKRTVICCLNAAKDGIKSIGREYPQIKIFSLFGPSAVNEHCYIIDGPGDSGDRCFNTKGESHHKKLF